MQAVRHCVTLCPVVTQGNTRNTRKFGIAKQSKIQKGQLKYKAWKVKYSHSGQKVQTQSAQDIT